MKPCARTAAARRAAGRSSRDPAQLSAGTTDTGPSPVSGSPMAYTSSQKNISVAQRLAFGFGTLVALSLLGSGISAWQAQVIAAKVERVVEVNNAMSDAVGHLRNSMDEMAIQVRSIALMTEMKSISAEIDN